MLGLSEIDHVMMSTAFAMARSQHGRTGENPAVGCVIADEQGRILAKGATQDGGRPHAEQTALESLSEGEALGATAYVTLEPCRERSNGTASCSERLIEAGIARVVYAIADPHPKGDGGAKRLIDAGIEVQSGLLVEQAADLYVDFFTSVSNRNP